MVYILEPEDGEYLSVSETIDKLKHEFLYVEIDQDQAEKEIWDQIEHLKTQRNRSIVDASFEEKLHSLKESINSCCSVTIADRSNWKNDYLSILLEPNKPIFFGFSSSQHEEAAAPLVERCGKVLNYGINEE